MDARISSVVERPLGSALTVDANAGTSVLTVSDGGEFDDQGTVQVGAEIKTFTSADDNTGVIQLSSNLASNHFADDPVYEYPLSTERIAWLVAGEIGRAHV